MAAGAVSNLDEGRQLRILINGVVDYAVYLLEPDGTIASWNPGGKRIKGYATSEVLGRNFSMFYTAEDVADRVPQQALRTATENGRYESEGWRVRKDGTRFWASVVIDAIHEGDELIGFAKVTRDISERREAALALQKAQDALMQSHKTEAISRLTLGLAHDFNNILTVITNSLDRIAASMPLLRRACDDAVQMHFDLAPELPAVPFDATQFEAALLNLVINARDAMPDGGRIDVASRLHTAPDGAQSIVVSVQDTGTGMPADVAARAMDPFFTTKEVGKGSGLGLSQVYGAISNLGGTVTIESEPGKGASVIMSLPVPASPQPTADLPS